MQIHHFMEYIIGESANWEAYEQAKQKINSISYEYSNKMKDTTGIFVIAP